MNFNVFSLANITTLITDYLGYLQIYPTVSSSNPPPQQQQIPAAVDDGAETLLEADYLAQQQQFDLSVLTNGWCILKDIVGQCIKALGSPLEFTDFQVHIGKTFLIILFVNLVLIGFYWKKYGSIITDRFIRPSTAKEIEELKLSVARLKLPKEHSPRIWTRPVLCPTR